jgi:hypothetical protein
MRGKGTGSSGSSPPYSRGLSIWDGRGILGEDPERKSHVRDIERQENSKLKRLVANLSLDNLVLKDFASGNF